MKGVFERVDFQSCNFRPKGTSKLRKPIHPLQSTNKPKNNTKKVKGQANKKPRKKNNKTKKHIPGKIREPKNCLFFVFSLSKPKKQKSKFWGPPESQNLFFGPKTLGHTILWDQTPKQPRKKQKQNKQAQYFRKDQGPQQLFVCFLLSLRKTRQSNFWGPPESQGKT